MARMTADERNKIIEWELEEIADFIKDDFWLYDRNEIYDLVAYLRPRSKMVAYLQSMVDISDIVAEVIRDRAPKTSRRGYNDWKEHFQFEFENYRLEAKHGMPAACVGSPEIYAAWLHDLSKND